MAQGINKMIADLRLCKCEEDVHLYYAKEIENLKDRIHHLEKTKAETGSNMTPVFVATKKTGGLGNKGWLAAGTVTFESVEFDPSGVFDKDKGEFVASKQGLYVFFFYCAVRGSNNKPFINVLVNGGSTNMFYGQGDGARGFTQLWSDNLKKGDKLNLKNCMANTLWTDGNDHMNFMGYLIA